uniref:Putative secreted protein n=1 Tax=Ixodes ricinus TaxID=34613 RepID=A0A6B0UUJ7_IXORI
MFVADVAVLLLLPRWRSSPLKTAVWQNAAELFVKSRKRNFKRRTPTEVLGYEEVRFGSRVQFLGEVVEESTVEQPMELCVPVRLKEHPVDRPRKHQARLQLAARINEVSVKVPCVVVRGAAPELREVLAGLVDDDLRHLLVLHTE